MSMDMDYRPFKTSSRQFGSMTSMESEETEENDRRSRLEQFRISMNGQIDQLIFIILD